MPTRILDFELREIPERLAGPERYTSALVLIRWDGHPAATVHVPLYKGTFKKSDLRERLSVALQDGLRERWVSELLPPTSMKRRTGRFKVTAAVCTRNRPEDLQKCLRALVRLPDDGQEILVVDNAPPNDLSEKVVRSFPGVKYVREDRVGLNCARNRALREARGEIVAFIDDDAVADKGWLRGICEAFDEPLTLCVTGLTLPLELEAPVQEEFERLSGFGRGFSRKRHSIETLSPAAGGAAGVGANMALRKDLGEKVGYFDEALDAGTATQSGGDAEMFSRIIGAGYDVIYEPGALNWHRHRRTRKELKRTMYGYGVGVYAAWTRSFLVEREWDVLGAAFNWFFKVQLRGAVRSFLGRPGAYPRDLMWEELRGSVWGPCAYWIARRAAARNALPTE